MVLLAKDIMDPSFLTVDEELVAQECAQRMVERRKGYAVVTRQGTTKTAGIVTEWDFLEKIVAPGIDPTQRRVKDLASTNLRTCAPDTPTDEVVNTMSTLGIRRMIVRTDDQVVGVITAKNVIASFRQYIDKLTNEIASFQSTQTPLG
jgi:signal-transduction protein with cAMP-binding, CBS, and nucleotidyltransferase domain